jgi:hypothetical protein
MSTRGKLLVLSLALVGLLTNGLWAADPAPSVGPMTIYVDDTAPGLNDGTSWFHAYRYLQDALQNVDSNAPSTTIKVAQGTYSPDDATGFPSQGREATFELKNRVELLGGFAGFGVPFPGERRIEQYETILDGDLDNDDISLNASITTDDGFLENHASRQENSFSVVTSIGNNRSAVLDGFTVRNGNANGYREWPYQWVRGGGIYMLTSDPIIESCLLTLNAASDGGGALSNQSSDTEIMNCRFVGNFTSGTGAGIFNSDAEPDIIGCEFIMNSTDYGDAGGGIYDYDSAPLIDDCLFKKNFAGFGGGIVSDDSDTSVRNCIFIDNRVGREGGAVSNWRTFANYTNCCFSGNDARDNGGGMENYLASVTLNRCTFNGNVADEAGGAIHSYGSDPNYINSVFSGNVTEEKGGALSFSECDASIINCTFYDNNAPEGRGIICYNIFTNSTESSDVIIHNSILWHDSNNIDIEDGSQVFVLYSDVKGGYPGPGNIGLPPRFANPRGWDQILGTPDDNLRILPNSPCIDAAQNYAVPAGIARDRDGSVRFFDDANTPDTGLGAPGDPIVDMGAYEFGSVNPYQGVGCGDSSGGGGPIPPIPPANQAPVADAGPDQLVFAWINNAAQVTLDGTGSYDPEGEPLNYSWNWIVNGSTYMTTGATPVILLPLGSHTINLIVGDGQLLSQPDQVQITVIQPQQVTLTMFPGNIQRGACPQLVYGIINIDQTSVNAIDMSEPLTLYPGNVQATGQSKYQSGPGSVGIIAQFSKDQITSANPNNGTLGVTVIGKFLTGQYFAGQDQIIILNCQ